MMQSRSSSIGESRVDIQVPNSGIVREKVGMMKDLGDKIQKKMMMVSPAKFGSKIVMQSASREEFLDGK